MKITNIDDLKKIAEGEIVELSGWDDNPFIVRVKRPSLQLMVAKGEIPNSLMTVATEAFYGKDKNTKMDMKKMSDLMFRIVDASLVEPSVKQLHDLGLDLTDQQMLEIFNYTQEGIEGLSRFRGKSSDSKGTKSK